MIPRWIAPLGIPRAWLSSVPRTSPQPRSVGHSVNKEEGGTTTVTGNRPLSLNSRNASRFPRLPLPGRNGRQPSFQSRGPAFTGSTSLLSLFGTNACDPPQESQAVCVSLGGQPEGTGCPGGLPSGRAGTIQKLAWLIFINLPFSEIVWCEMEQCNCLTIAACKTVLDKGSFHST